MRGAASAGWWKVLDATWASAVPPCCELIWFFTVAACLRPVFARGLRGHRAFTVERQVLAIALVHSSDPVVTQWDCSFR